MNKGVGMVGALLMIIGLSMQIWHTYFRGDIRTTYVYFSGIGIEFLGFLILIACVLSLMRKARRIGMFGALLMMAGIAIQEIARPRVMYEILRIGLYWSDTLNLAGIGMMVLGVIILIAYILSLMQKGNEIGIVGALLTTVGVPIRHYVKWTIYATENPSLNFVGMGIEVLGVIILTARAEKLLMLEKREEQFNFAKKVVALILIFMLGLWFGFFVYPLINSTGHRLWGVPPLIFSWEPLILSSPLILFVLIQLRDRNTKQVIHRTLSFSAGTILGFSYTYGWWHSYLHHPAWSYHGGMTLFYLFILSVHLFPSLLFTGSFLLYLIKDDVLKISKQIRPLKPILMLVLLFISPVGVSILYFSFWFELSIWERIETIRLLYLYIIFVLASFIITLKKAWRSPEA